METPRQIAIYSKSLHDSLLEELKLAHVSILNSTPSALWLGADSFEPSWADCVWRDVRAVKIESIGDAGRKLQSISKKWRYYGDLLNRRGALIAEKLFTEKEVLKVEFPSLVLGASTPVFTMADTNTVLYSFDISRPTVDGKIPFNEKKDIPQSRAYLKLWEALTIIGDWPKKGEKVIDLGSSPGSWTWALAELGSDVLSIDRASLDEKVMRAKNITFKKGDAFSVEPGEMDWVFSDVICFPDKLLEYVQQWLRSGHCRKFVCNIKLTDKAQLGIVEEFRKIPHSRVIHLLNGKHELTWICHPKLR